MANFIPGGNGGCRESFVERQAEINAACSSFIKIGFRPELFTINNLHKYGYTGSKFLELIKPISFIGDLGALRFLFNTARESLCSDPFVSLHPTEFCVFVYCINWMKTELPARMKKEMTKADVALARVLVEYAAPVTRKCKRIQSEIDELKKRQMELEREYSKMSAELKLKLGPIYEYEEPSISQLRIESYLLYEKDCRYRGIRPTPIPKLDEMTCADLVDVFGGAVKERHLIKFLNDPIRKELVQTYLKGFAAMSGDGF
ncbi:unnamed protein product [Lathyrus oleraceus]